MEKERIYVFYISKAIHVPTRCSRLNIFEIVIENVSEQELREKLESLDNGQEWMESCEVCGFQNFMHEGRCEVDRKVKWEVWKKFKKSVKCILKQRKEEKRSVEIKEEKKYLYRPN